MNLKEKIAQLFIAGFDGLEWEKNSVLSKCISTYGLGGVILFDYNFKNPTYKKNILNPDQVRNLNYTIQKNNPQKLPLFISIDYEGGNVNRLKSDNGFPETITAKKFASLPNNLAINFAKRMAVTLKDLGFNLNFAPVVDLDINAKNPIISKLDRSFSNNPTEVIRCAMMIAQSLLEQKIQCAFKHFPGHGSSLEDSHLGFTDVTDTWQMSELEPYEKLLTNINNWGMIMTAHVINKNLDPSGLPATFSKAIIKGILRDKFKFDGIIISDDLQMKAISDYFGINEALLMSIEAGVDMFIIGNQLSETEYDIAESINYIEKHVNAGNISVDRIEESWLRVQKTKQKFLY